MGLQASMCKNCKCDNCSSDVVFADVTADAMQVLTVIQDFGHSSLTVSDIFAQMADATVCWGRCKEASNVEVGRGILYKLMTVMLHLDVLVSKGTGEQP